MLKAHKAYNKYWHLKEKMKKKWIGRVLVRTQSRYKTITSNNIQSYKGVKKKELKLKMVKKVKDELHHHKILNIHFQSEYCIRLT